MPIEIIASLTHLEGYVVLAEPVQNFPPLTLLGLAGNDDEATHLGLLTDLCPTSGDALKASTPEAASALSGEAKSHLHLNVSTDALGSLFKLLGIDFAPDVSLSTDSTTTITFSFGDAQRSCISFIAALTWLNRVNQEEVMLLR